MRRVTIDDVAREAGVSRQTVSRAINHKRDISVETRERVLSVVQRLGFRPNRVAQSMITQRSFTIGMEVIDITNPVFAEMVRGAQDTAARYGYNILLTNSNDDPDVALQSLSTLVTHGIDGLVAMFPNVADEQILSFADQYQPVVLINRVVTAHPHVTMLTVDIHKGAILALEHLLAQGHTAIGMLANRNHPHAKNRRLLAYQESLRARDLPSPLEWIHYAAPTLDGGYHATLELLKVAPTITAIFAYNDLMAIGAMRACRDMGRAVPQEIAIVGFDNIPLAELVHPSLTTIQYDKYGLGQQAILHILHQLNESERELPPAELVVTLIERESSRHRLNHSQNSC